MERTREFAISILDLFEDLLDEKGIDIPSEDRTGEEGEARLYGTEYFQLEDDVTNLLEQFEDEFCKK